MVAHDNLHKIVFQDENYYAYVLSQVGVDMYSVAKFLSRTVENDLTCVN